MCTLSAVSVIQTYFMAAKDTQYLLSHSLHKYNKKCFSDNCVPMHDSCSIERALAFTHVYVDSSQTCTRAPQTLPFIYVLIAALVGP